MYTSTCFLSMLEQHSESDWHRSLSQFSIWFQDNSHILKTLIIQYIIKISSVSQNIKPNVLETKSYVYIMHLRKALRVFFKLTILNNSTAWVKNVAELNSNWRP